jgi:hypothetical protein
MANRVLFISGRCPYSKKILLGIHQHSFLKDIFQIVNIDSQPYPNYIKSIPCILINNQVVAGDKVFEYLGKIVESKMAQEQREEAGQLKDEDEGVCKINEEGELEGYCGSGDGVGFSTITEENDDYTKKRHGTESNYDFLEGQTDSKTVYKQLKQMEESDDQLGQKRKNFDSDYERMQSERGELMGQGGPGGPGGPGPPMG